MYRERQDFVAYLNRGLSLLNGLRIEEAVLCFEMALCLQPDCWECWVHLASALYSTKQLGRSVVSYRRAIRLMPCSPELNFNLGLVLNESNQQEEAIKALNEALSLNPGISTIHYNLGQAQRALGRHLDAEAAYRKAIRIAPHEIDAFLSLGTLLQEQNRRSEAITVYRTADEINTRDARIHSNLGNVLKDIGSVDEAKRRHYLAVCLAPQEGNAYINLGNTLRAGGRLEQAVSVYRKAGHLLPRNPRVNMNIGCTLYEMGQPEAAEKSFGRAIQMEPDFAEAHWNRGLAHLLYGMFPSGWTLYEWRFKHTELHIHKKDLPTPEWDGLSSLAGKRILLYAEQGLGDTLQFVRFALVLEAQGAKVIVEVQAPLYDFLARALNVTVIAQNDLLPEHDLHFPLMSLPKALGTNEHNIPFSRGYLKPDPTRLEKWTRILGDQRRPRVGLVVSGNPNHSNDARRSIPLEQVAAHLPAGVDYFLLQKEIRSSDINVVEHLPDALWNVGQIHDFDDTAALCCMMDLVISVDTSVAHLCGALGVPTWIMLPQVPDWRWLLKRASSPWYARVRLYRQDEGETWEAVLARIGSDVTSER